MSAAAYAASATEYLVSEVCELAGDRRREIVHEQVSDAMKKNELVLKFGLRRN